MCLLLVESCVFCSFSITVSEKYLLLFIVIVDVMDICVIAPWMLIISGFSGGDSDFYFLLQLRVHHQG